MNPVRYYDRSLEWMALGGVRIRHMWEDQPLALVLLNTQCKCAPFYPLCLSLPGGLQILLFELFQSKQSGAAEVLKAWHETYTDHGRDPMDLHLAGGDTHRFSLIHLGWACGWGPVWCILHLLSGRAERCDRRESVACKWKHHYYVWKACASVLKIPLSKMFMFTHLRVIANLQYIRYLEAEFSW